MPPLGLQSRRHILDWNRPESETAKKVHNVIFANQVNIAGKKLQQAADYGPAHPVGAPVLVYRQAGQLAKFGIRPQPATTQNRPALTFGDHELAVVQLMQVAIHQCHQFFDGGQIISAGLSNVPNRVNNLTASIGVGSCSGCAPAGRR